MERATSRLTFARPGGAYFQIGPGALAEMRRFIQDGVGKPEAGGVLLGRHLLGIGDIIVDRVTPPLPGDRRGRFRFHRARRRHQEAIDRAWGESDGTCTYLGEWHTHPQDHPEPSCIDRLDWWRKLRVDRFSEPIFFVIVGIVETRVWEGCRNGHVAPLREQ